MDGLARGSRLEMPCEKPRVLVELPSSRHLGEGKKIVRAQVAGVTSPAGLKGRVSSR